MKTQPSTFHMLRFRLLMAGAICGLLVYSLMIGIVAGGGHNTRTMLLLAAPAAALVCVLAVQRFQFLVLTLPLLALAVPIEFPTGTESTLPISMMLTLLLTTIWCASMAIRSWKLAPSPLNRPMLAFCALCIISLFWGIIWRDPLVNPAPKFLVMQVGALAAILLSFSAALLIGNFVTTRAQLKYLLGIFLFCGSLMTLTQLFHIPQHFLNDKGLWGLWLIAPAYSLLIAQPKLRWYWRALLLLVLALTLYQTVVVNADWLSGWMPSIVAILAITFLHSRKAFFALLIVMALGGYLMRDFFLQVVADNIADGSLERLTIWEQNWRVVRAHWLLGTGPAGYAVYYITYYRDTARSTHNNYLDILAQFGFSGMLIWVWLSFAGLREGWKLIQRVSPGVLRTMALVATGGWVGALAAMFYGDWVLPFAYNVTISGYKFTVYSWIFFGTLISIRRLAELPANASGMSPSVSQ